MSVATLFQEQFIYLFIERYLDRVKTYSGPKPVFQYGPVMTNTI